MTRSEIDLLISFILLVFKVDPDIIAGLIKIYIVTKFYQGYDIEKASLFYLAMRFIKKYNFLFNMNLEGFL